MDKEKRQQKILSLIRARPIGTQQELAEQLEKRRPEHEAFLKEITARIESQRDSDPALSLLPSAKPKPCSSIISS